MNAFLYLQKLIKSPQPIEVIKTSDHHDGDLSFYWPDFTDQKSLSENRNIHKIQHVNGFWNIKFTPGFWNQQLIGFLQNPRELPNFSKNSSPYFLSFQSLYKKLMDYYKITFEQSYNISIMETPDLTNPQDLAIIKYIIEWHFRHVVLGNSFKINDKFYHPFFDWWRSNKIKGSVLRIIDPKDLDKTNERMLIPVAYNKIIRI